MKFHKGYHSEIWWLFKYQNIDENENGPDTLKLRIAPSFSKIIKFLFSFREQMIGIQVYYFRNERLRFYHF